MGRKLINPKMKQLNLNLHRVKWITILAIQQTENLIDKIILKNNYFLKQTKNFHYNYHLVN